MKLREDIGKLNSEIVNLRQKNKELTKSVYIKDSFIAYISGQCKLVLSGLLRSGVSES